jgi:hypothetical protein
MWDIADQTKNVKGGFLDLGDGGPGGSRPKLSAAATGAVVWLGRH